MLFEQSQVRTHGGHGELVAAAWDRWAPRHQVQGEELSGSECSAIQLILQCKSDTVHVCWGCLVVAECYRYCAGRW